MRAEIDALTKRLAAIEADAPGSASSPPRARNVKSRQIVHVIALVAVFALLAAVAGASVVYGQDAIDAIIVNVKGNVGIGTSDIPDEYRLDVKGSVLVEEGDLVVNSPSASALTVTGAFTPTGGVEFRTEDEMQGIGFGSNTIYATGTMADQNLNLMARGTGAVNVNGELVVNSPNARALYVTGAFTPTGGVEFRTENETEGIGFGANTIYATGSDDDQNLNLTARGSGIVDIDAPLNVSGDITFGPSGLYNTPGAEEKLRIVRGIVGTSPAGPLVGSGFSVVRTDPAIYVITFSPGFSESPSVTANSYGVGDGKDNFVVIRDVTKESVTVATYDYGGSRSLQDGPFTFIAIGPR